MKKDLVLVGYTLGASIALQYGLDYPEEVKGLVIMTVAARPKTRGPGTYDMRIRAAKDPKVYEDEWIAFQREAMHLVEPGLRERLMEQHRQVGPMSQYHDLMTIDAFDVRERIATLKPKLLLLRGLQDHGNPPEYEKEIHEAVPGSQYVKLPDAGHFPVTEIPEKVNALIEEVRRRPVKRASRRADLRRDCRQRRRAQSAPELDPSLRARELQGACATERRDSSRRSPSSTSS